MKFHDMIHEMQQEAAFSEEEAKDALEMTVESLAVHLNEGERKDFASQLPQELKDIALSVYPTETTASQDLVEQVMEVEHLPESRARQHLLTAWRILTLALSPGQIAHIKAQLPLKTVTFLG